MLIKREILPEILNWLDKNKILIIKGSRQVGKTTLLKVIQQQLEQNGKKTLYLSADQEISNPILATSKNLGQFIRDQFPELTHTNKLYLFLDEWQYLQNSGLFLKTLFDTYHDKLQLIVSGSSSLEITKNSEFLTGRKIEFYLYPLSYHEFLTYKSAINLPTPLSLTNFQEVEDFYTTYRAYLNEHLLEYAGFGGYPEIVTTSAVEDKVRLLQELIRTYIDKDIIAFLRIENVSGFNNLLHILCDQIGQLVNKSEISNTINLNLETLNKYLDILEGTYVLNLVRPYFTNLRKQLSKMSKVFVNDLGMRQIVLKKQLPVWHISGSERENLAYNMLKKNHGQENIKFYRTISKAEVDFVVETAGGIVPIEVKSAKKLIKVPRILNEIKQKYGIILTDDILLRQKDIYFIPLPLLEFLQFS